MINTNAVRVRPKDAWLSRIWQWLSRCDDFVKADTQQHTAQDVKQNPVPFRVAWVPRRHIAGGGVGRLNKNALQGMIYPLPDADKEQPQAHQQDVCVGDAPYLERQCSNSTGRPDDDEDLVPVLYFEPGWHVTHLPPSSPFSLLFNSIERYADEHSLTPNDVERIFNAGLAARHNLLKTPAGKPTTEVK